MWTVNVIFTRYELYKNSTGNSTRELGKGLYYSCIIHRTRL